MVSEAIFFPVPYKNCKYKKKTPRSARVGCLIRRHSVPAFRQASNSGKWARMEGQNDNIFTFSNRYLVKIKQLIPFPFQKCC